MNSLKESAQKIIWIERDWLQNHSIETTKKNHLNGFQPKATFWRFSRHQLSAQPLVYLSSSLSCSRHFYWHHKREQLKENWWHGNTATVFHGKMPGAARPFKNWDSTCCVLNLVSQRRLSVKRFWIFPFNQTRKACYLGKFARKGFAEWRHFLLFDFLKLKSFDDSNSLHCLRLHWVYQVSCTS